MDEWTPCPKVNKSRFKDTLGFDIISTMEAPSLAQHEDAPTFRGAMWGGDG